VKEGRPFRQGGLPVYLAIVKGNKLRARKKEPSVVIFLKQEMGGRIDSY
jgi:hypothetical protein